MSGVAEAASEKAAYVASGEGTATAAEAAHYHTALAQLRARGHFGIHLGLGRTRALLHGLGDPHRAIPGVLIGGTNGKGSVQAMVAAVLRETGVGLVGQTPKPHLVTYRERILVDGRPIAPADFARLITDVLRVAESVPARLGVPTEFELLTAAAFRWFAESDVAIAVVEVGLGGRLDATNAWGGGVAALTSIGLDHTEYLGHTLSSIGREKAAIIKRGDLAVSGVTGDGALPIRRRARRLGVSLQEVTPLTVRGMDRAGIILQHPTYGTLRVGLLGRHQALNAAVAVAILEALERAGIAPIAPEALRNGLATVRWPGRLELLRIDPVGIDVVLDGAHNVDGARALAAGLDELAPLLQGGRATLLMGALRDKDAVGMVGALAGSELLRSAHMVTTGVPDSPRSMSAPELASIWRQRAPRRVFVETVEDPSLALAAAVETARAAGGPLICCGSLYLIGAVRGWLVDEPELRDPPAPGQDRR